MDGLKLKDFLEYNFLSDLNVSPDGRWAAFVVHRCDARTNGYLSYIYLMDMADFSCRRLTGGGEERSYIWVDDDCLIFSCSRNKAAAAGSERGEAMTSYYAIGTGGEEAFDYMTVPLKVSKIRSIGGGRFVVAARYDASAGDACMTGEDVGDVVMADRGYWELCEVPFWTNGTGFTDRTRIRLYLYDRNVGSVLPLSSESENVQMFDIDGDRLVYSFVDYGSVMGRYSRLKLCSVSEGTCRELIGEDRFRIRYGGFVNGSVVFAGSEMKGYGLGQNPYFYRVDGHGGPVLICEYDRGINNSVSTDCKYGGGETFRSYGQSLYFVSTEWGQGVVRRLTAQGTVVDVIDSDGSVDCFDLYDGGILFIGFRGIGLQEIYLYVNGVERPLTRLNVDVLKDKKLSVPERCDVLSDGYVVEGYVMKPVDYDEGGKYPAILCIHGGPRTAFGSVFFHELQLWANEGYFVLYCNPRGSDGRGNDFSDLRDRYGTIDFADVMRFTDRVLECYGAVDCERMGVTGGSYGGFMTNWIIGHTDRFACAVSLRGISNWFSFSLTSDCGYDFVEDQHGGTLWLNPDSLWSKSPVKYADRVRTPALFIHADEDYRCWLVEGLQMYAALKYNGAEAKMCIFKGENHELSRSGRPANRIRRLEIMAEWFAKFLK